jgi:hypothetical protein
MGLLPDQDNHGRGPRHFHSEQALDCPLAHQAFVQPPLVGRLRADGTVPDVVAATLQHLSHSGYMLVILMVVADENVPSV